MSCVIDLIRLVSWRIRAGLCSSAEASLALVRDLHYEASNGIELPVTISLAAVES